MNNEIAYVLIDSELQRLRALSYAELAALVGANDNKEVVGKDGNTYQLEMEVRWDSKKDQDVRVFVSASEGFWRAFSPLTRCFIKRPDETYVGETPATD